jgi:hypothetical protein
MHQRQLKNHTIKPKKLNTLLRLFFKKNDLIKLNGRKQLLLTEILDDSTLWNSLRRE